MIISKVNFYKMFTFENFPEDMESNLNPINDFLNYKNIVEFEKSLNGPNDYIKKNIGWITESKHIE